MAEPVERPVCSRCSIPGVMGTVSIKVLLGDGNCGECNKASASAAALAAKNMGGPNDGPGGDHNQPYRWGVKLTIDRLGAFTAQQYVNLSRLRSAIQDRIIDSHRIINQDGF